MTDAPQKPDTQPALCDADPGAALRRTAYGLMIAVAAGLMLGRVLGVDSVDTGALEKSRLARIPRQLAEKRTRLESQGAAPHRIEEELARTHKALDSAARLSRPFLSANDRSRWCTIRALVDEDMRVPGAPYAIDKVIQEPGWDTIDMVKHDRRPSPGAAGEPWVQSDGKHLYSSKPPLFPTIVAGEYWLIWQLTGMTLDTDPHAVVRIILITVNVIPLLFAFVLLARLIERFGTTDFGRLFTMAAATFGTFLTTFSVVINNHLIAAVCTAIALYAAVRICFDGKRNWWHFASAGLFVAFAAANDLPALALFGLIGVVLLVRAPLKTLFVFTPAAAVVVGAFFWTNWIAHQDLVPAYMHRSATDPTDNWYDYTYDRNGTTYESYWLSPVGVDKGEPSPAVYAMHVLVGHHGVFSLTPVWLFSAVGLCLWLFSANDRRLRWLALLIGIVTVACLAFYLSRPLHFRNYGGVTSGLRWLFWLAPLWLVAMLPAVAAAGRRTWTRWLAVAALVLSVLSATYPTWNPWIHPWLMVWCHYMGWVG